VAP
jgi:hypothetical protein